MLDMNVGLIRFVARQEKPPLWAGALIVRSCNQLTSELKRQTDLSLEIPLGGCYAGQERVALRSLPGTELVHLTFGTYNP